MCDIQDQPVRAVAQPGDGALSMCIILFIPQIPEGGGVKKMGLDFPLQCPLTGLKAMGTN